MLLKDSSEVEDMDLKHLQGYIMVHHYATASSVHHGTSWYIMVHHGTPPHHHTTASWEAQPSSVHHGTPWYTTTPLLHGRLSLHQYTFRRHGYHTSFHFHLLMLYSNVSLHQINLRELNLKFVNTYCCTESSVVTRQFDVGILHHEHIIKQMNTLLQPTITNHSLRIQHRFNQYYSALH